MKLKAIEYHLERAAHFRALAALDSAPGPGYVGPAVAAVRAAKHEQLAADYLAEGLREYAGRARTPGALVQRRRRRRLAVDPRTDPAVAGSGRGLKASAGWVGLGRGRGFGRKELP